MGVSLKKGGNISLTNSVPGLKSIFIGLGWDARDSTGVAFDLDASAFLLTEEWKVPSDSHFIFFNNKKSPDGAVEYLGDNRTGVGTGDDEVITINLNSVDPQIKTIAFTVTIYKADSHNQNFGMVRNASIRVVNLDNSEELARYDLSEDFGLETAMVFGEVYRRNDEWKFRAVGNGFVGGLETMANNFGVHLG